MSRTRTRRGRRPPRTQRGDVPGWVLITVMTAALVAGLLAIAGPELNQMLREALASVR
jgi:Tfp pilus assembly protein PilX